MSFSIEVKKRVGTVEAIREQGFIPAVVYGPEAKPESVSVSKAVFDKLYEDAGESNLIDLNVEGAKEPFKVLIQDVQVDPVKSNFIHVDFLRINMNKVMSATIPIEFVGESEAVKALGGTLIENLQELNIECLPNDLVDHIEVDISVLKTFDDIVHVSDLKLPKGITSADNLNTVVVKVAPPLTEEQLKAMEESGPKGVEDVESAKPKKEKEEGAVDEKADKKDEKAAK